ncbi:MAG: hypothetical protein LC777_05080, partial [Actinobacteria bacterium]|nr:hypothetical protein [Actinomycetota bacterium]
GELRRPARQTASEVLCEACRRILWPRTFVRCGSSDVASNHRVCPACSLHARVDQLRENGLPSAIEQLAPYLNEVAGAPHPGAVIQWLRRPGGGRTLHELARGDLKLSHDALDGVGQRKGTEHLRAALVHAGVLAPRDELLIALATWTSKRLSVIAAGPDHSTLRSFATWKVARELAARRQRRSTPDPLAAGMPKQWIAAAIALTAWLHDRALTLADLDQALLDEWLADRPAGRRTVRPFIAWLERQHGRRGLRVPADQPGTPALALNDAEHLRALADLLEDDSIKAHVRVAECLVALYAQPVARIVRLTTSDLTLTTQAAHVRLGRDLVALPAPLRPAASTMLQRANTRQTSWLLPGRKAGLPASPVYLAKRLRELGVPVARARSGALAALAHRIPAPVLADVLGLSAKTTIRASDRLNVDYAAYVARRLANTAPAPPAPGDATTAEARSDPRR